jgi:2-methylcitrate dehydratase PrpD
MKLDEAHMVTALGLASTKAAGLKSQFGTMGKPLNAGLAAEAGVLSAQWAKFGLTSTEAGLSGPLGFGATHHGQNNLSGFDAMGKDWYMTTVSHKFHACCHGLHAMLEALAGITGDIASLHVFTHTRWMTVCNNLAPASGLECKFSYAMTAAMTLCGVSTVQIENFSAATAANPKLIDLRDRVVVQADNELTEQQSRCVITFADGTSQTVFHDLNAPRTVAEQQIRLLAKARAVIGGALADELWAAIAGNDLKHLQSLLGRTSR